MQKLLTFFSKNISVYAILSDQSLNDTSTNDTVSFEQLDPVDVSQVVCPQVSVLDAWRLTDPDGFFDLSEPRIILPVKYVRPHQIDDMVNILAI